MEDLIRIACIGDSNTFGFDPQSLIGSRYPRAVRWTGRLDEGGFAVKNLGVNGLCVSRLSLHSFLLSGLRTGPRPDFVTVMLGSNDLLTGLSVEETGEAMRRLLIRVREENAADRILLIAPPPFVHGVWVDTEEQIEASHRLAAEYEKVSEETGVLFADAGTWHIPLAFDGVHFTEEGHRIFAEKLAEILRGYCAD